MKRKDGKKPSAAKQRRQQQLAEVNAELDQLVAEFHALLSRCEASQTGGIYARYSTQFQDSIVDQVRSLLEFAVRNQIFVPREFIFVDLAEKGGKERRPGLMQLREALAERKFKVLLVFSTNRFFRKAYKSVKLVEEEIVERGLRCIFVKSGIDTGDKDRWRLHLQMLAAMDEAYSTIYSENIRAALVGLASQKFVHGTLAHRPGPIAKPVGQRTDCGRGKRLDPRSRGIEQTTQSGFRGRRKAAAGARFLLPIGALARGLSCSLHCFRAPFGPLRQTTERSQGSTP